MTENKLNPFEDGKEECVNSVASDASELASERRQQNVRKIDIAVSDHALLRCVRYTRLLVTTNCHDFCNRHHRQAGCPMTWDND